jgi:hypothetical protein
MEPNLNNWKIETDGDPAVSGELPDGSFNTKSLAVYFRDIKVPLISMIRQYPYVVGCLAWLTDFDILDELAKKKGVALVVQKEDFLRPDFNVTDRPKWRKQLREKYDALKAGTDRFSYRHTVIPELSTHSDYVVEPVRCVGNYNRDRVPAFPRMHHKFALFCEYEEDIDEDEHYSDDFGRLVPQAVWTGSFNWTSNASMSLENAIVTTLPHVVHAYWTEFGAVMALSEPLDWTTDWAAPEWRIGT